MTTNSYSKAYLKLDIITPALQSALSGIGGLIDIVFNYVRGDLLLVGEEEHGEYSIEDDLNSKYPIDCIYTIDIHTKEKTKILETETNSMSRFSCIFDNHYLINIDLYNSVVVLDLHSGARFVCESSIERVYDVCYIHWRRQLIKIHYKSLFYVSVDALKTDCGALWQYQCCLPFHSLVTNGVFFGVDKKQQKIYIFYQTDNTTVLIYQVQETAAGVSTVVPSIVPTLAAECYLLGIFYVEQWGGFILTGSTTTRTTRTKAGQKRAQESWFYNTKCHNLVNLENILNMRVDLDLYLKRSYWLSCLEDVLIVRTLCGTVYKLDMMGSQSPTQLLSLYKGLSPTMTMVATNCVPNFCLSY